MKPIAKYNMDRIYEFYRNKKEENYLLSVICQFLLLIIWNFFFVSGNKLFKKRMVQCRPS